MEIRKYEFTGNFNLARRIEINAPTLEIAKAIFVNTDMGDGYGIPNVTEADNVSDIGLAYNFNGTTGEWFEAVILGEVE